MLQKKISMIGILSILIFFQPIATLTLPELLNGFSSLKSLTRSADGKNNNLDHPNWGSSFIPLERKQGLNMYSDKIQKPRTDLKSPRQISNIVGSQVGPIQLSKNKLSLMFTIFAQYVDHQHSQTESQDNSKTIPMAIKVPKSDKFFDPQSTGRAQIPFTRSKGDMSSGVMNQINVITAWVDGSAIYGSNLATQKSLRTFQNGKMKTSRNNLLPKDSNNFFIAGDGRVNENIALIAIHTIFVRQHNRMCDFLATQDPTIQDEQLFQTVRNFIIGVIAKIIYDDFLPILLGKEGFNRFVGPYKGYDATVSPNILNEFATGAYRIGHPLLVDDFPQINAQNKVTKTFKLSQIFFRNNFYKGSSQLESTLRGIIQTSTKQKSCSLVDSVRNFLLTGPQAFKLDLFSLNVQRGRDHGIPTYNKCRSIFGLSPFKSTSQITKNAQEVTNLNSAYQNIDNVQLFPGIICQTPLNGAVVGELGAAIIGDGFKRARDGDRFWYENIYPSSVVQEIKRTTLSHIIARNTKITGLPKNVFTTVSP